MTTKERVKKTKVLQKHWAHENGGRCIYAGCPRSAVGCHIYGKGPHPRHSAILHNGVGLCSRHHTIFDAQRKTKDMTKTAVKIVWLREHTDPEFAEFVHDRLEGLAKIVQADIEANEKE